MILVIILAGVRLIVILLLINLAVQILRVVHGGSAGRRGVIVLLHRELATKEGTGEVKIALGVLLEAIAGKITAGIQLFMPIKLHATRQLV